MEWGRTFFIFFVFGVLASYTIASVGVKNIQENWPTYRCNPMYMPFASSLAPVPTTASENFSYCMHDFMTSAAPSLTQPLSYVQSMTLSLMGSMTESNESSVKQTSEFSFSVSNLFQGLFSIISGVAGQFNVIFQKLADAQGKMTGAMAAVVYIVASTQYTFMSMWNGIPGSMIRTFGDVKMKDAGSSKKKKK